MDVTLVADTDTFSYRSLQVGEAFGVGRPRRYSLESLVADVRRRFIQRASRVDPRRRARAGARRRRRRALRRAAAGAGTPQRAGVRPRRDVHTRATFEEVLDDLRTDFAGDVTIVVPRGRTLVAPRLRARADDRRLEQRASTCASSPTRQPHSTSSATRPPAPSPTCSKPRGVELVTGVQRRRARRTASCAQASTGCRHRARGLAAGPGRATRCTACRAPRTATWTATSMAACGRPRRLGGGRRHGPADQAGWARRPAGRRRRRGHRAAARARPRGRGRSAQCSVGCCAPPMARCTCAARWPSTTAGRRCHTSRCGGRRRRWPRGASPHTSLRPDMTAGEPATGIARDTDAARPSRAYGQHMNTHHVIVAGGGVAGLESSPRPSRPGTANAPTSPFSSHRSSWSTARCSSPARSRRGTPSAPRSPASSARRARRTAARARIGRPRGAHGDDGHRRHAALRLARARARRPGGSRLRARHNLLAGRPGRAGRAAARPRGGLQLERRVRRPAGTGLAVSRLRARAAHRARRPRHGRRRHGEGRDARSAPARGVRVNRVSTRSRRRSASTA